MSARTPRQPEAPLTKEQLALAWRHLRRPWWPTTLEAALAHPVYGKALQGVARNFARASLCGPARTAAPPASTAPQQPVPATPAEPPATARQPRERTSLGAWPRRMQTPAPASRTPTAPRPPWADPHWLAPATHHPAHRTPDRKRLAANDRDDD